MSPKSPYDDLVMDHIKNARNFRVPEDANRQSQGANPLCGDEVTVYLKLKAGSIEDVAFHCTCCGISMASASMLTESIVGRSVEDARVEARRVVDLIRGQAAAGSVRDEWLAALLATTREFPARVGCATLAWTTLDAALDGCPAAGPE